MTEHSPGGTSRTAFIDAPDDRRRILGLPLPWFALLFVVLAAATATGAVEPSMLTGFTTLMLLGGLLYWLGERVPRLRDFGLPTLLCLLVPPVLSLLGAFPAGLSEAVDGFTIDSGFIDFYIAALIAGSILGMPRALLVSAGLRYALPLVAVIVSVFAVVGALGAVTGFGLREAMLFVAAPVVGGGIGAGAVPMSQMYAASLGGAPADYMTLLVPSVVVANTIAILMAGAYGGLARGDRQLFPGFNGNGTLVRSGAGATSLQTPPRATRASFRSMAVGLVFSGTLLLLGELVNQVVPAVHGYAWTILAAALLKITGALPESITESVVGWYGFVATTMTPALLVGVGVSLLDLGQLGALLGNPVYLGLTAAALVTAALVAGGVGWLVGLFFVETSVAIGLGTTDMGGSGDIAVVSASNRLELMPFLQVSSRIGGALVLLLLSFLVPVLA